MPGAGYDISASSSDATTQGQSLGVGNFTVGGNKALDWLPLALVGLVLVGVVLWFKRVKIKS